MATDKADYWLTADGLALVQGWARDGLTFEQIAENIGIDRRTLTRWRDKHAALATVLAFGREVADRHVENALYKRALGYEYIEKKTRVKELPNGTREREVIETKKQMAPDVVAQIFYLKNRKPGEWRDRVDHEISGQVGLVQIIDDLPKP